MSSPGSIFIQHKDIYTDVRLEKCRFLNCNWNSGGGIYASGCFLTLFGCTFVDCVANVDCGGLRVNNGILNMNCIKFDQCHASGGDINSAGTALGAINCDVFCRDILFHQCWNSTSSYKDNIYGLGSGKFDISRLNISKCVGHGGGLGGCFISSKAGTEVTFINIEGGQENNIFEAFYQPLTVSYVNIIGNLVGALCFTNSAEITIRYANIFKNSPLSENGRCSLIECFSDTYEKAIITDNVTTHRIKYDLICGSKPMTILNPLEINPFLLIVHTFIT